MALAGMRVGLQDAEGGGVEGVMEEMSAMSRSESVSESSSIRVLRDIGSFVKL